MGLQVQSLYPFGTIYVCYTYCKPDCDNANSQYEKLGWWTLEYGETVELVSGDLTDGYEYYTYYAESSDGAAWDGPYIRKITDNIFNQCEFDDTNMTRSAGFALIDVNGSDDIVLQLTPPAFQSQTGLTGAWTCDDGGTYYLRQDGNTIWWAGLSGDRNLQQGLSFCNVFLGQINGLTVNGSWADVPRGLTNGTGTLSLQVQYGAGGAPLHLTKTGSAGGFGGSKWDFQGRTGRWGLYSMQDLFGMINKNVWKFGPQFETLTDNLDIIKEFPVVSVFGRLQASNAQGQDVQDDGTLPFGTSFPTAETLATATIDDFYNLNSYWYPGSADADMATYIACRSDELPLDFFSNIIDAEGPTFLETKLQELPIDPCIQPPPFRPQNVVGIIIHPEIVMYGSIGPKEDPDQPPIPLLPGWGNVPGAPADSILINGRPLNGRITLTTAGGAIYLDNGVQMFSPQNNDAVRITGVLAADHGHTPRILEIHPVFAIDLITNAEIGPPDLSGTWATTDGGTCYIRVINSDVWFLWNRPLMDNRHATVFRGRQIGSTIGGVWMDVPLGLRAASDTLKLNVQANYLIMTTDVSTPGPGNILLGITWRKLYGLHYPS